MNPPCTSASNRTRRVGLTLMELVVVMTILTAIAGIVLALMPNLLTKTHDAVTVSNISEINKAIMGYLSTNLTYPDYFDSLTNSSGALYSKAVFNPANPSADQPTPRFTAYQLQAGEAKSLIKGGIANLMVMQDPPSSDGATYGAYVGPPTASGATTAVASGTNVMKVVDPLYVLTALHVQPKTDMTYGTDYNYIVFGLGQYSALVGSTAYGVFEAPVSFGEHGYEQPLNAYARMLCLFRVYSNGDRCEYLGAAHPDPEGFGTAAMHTQEFYETK